jgi:hypothetical protein
MKKVGKATAVVVSGGVAMKPRAIFEGVKRSVCHKCGGCYGKSPAPNVKECDCPEGWSGTVTNLGVMADSGPRRFWPRLFWRVGQWIAGLFERIDFIGSF